MNGQKRLEELQQQLRKTGVRLLKSGEPPANELATGCWGDRDDNQDSEQLEKLAPDLSKIGQWSGSATTENLVSTGCAALDSWFPQGGMVRGQTIELVSSTRASGATYFALILARQICQTHGLFVLIDRNQDFHPAILLALGFDLNHVLLVHPQSEEDHLWALEQALADSCVAVVWTQIDKIDKRYQRRWQLAAERGQTIGLLQRPERALGHPTWATIQLEVRANPHSHWLTGNRRAAGNWPGITSGDETDLPNNKESAEHWIIQLVAHRSARRFESSSLQIELHNRSWKEWLSRPNASETKGSTNWEEWFFSQRLPHPNDPWFTKPSMVVSDQATVDNESRGPSRVAADGASSRRRGS
jgi:hypothetical protein